MITYGMTAGNDNAIIWLIELELSSGNLYFCSGHNTASVSLSTGSESRVYTNALQKNSLSIYPHSIPAESAGGFGSRNGFTFIIAGFGGYDQNDFYPATGGATVIMRPCRIGWIWSGATATSEITWLHEGEVENFEVRPDGVFIDVVESSFLDYVQLPPYAVQKDTDDGISYFPQAPKDSLGRPIPIVFGRFNILTLEFGKHRLCPAILVNPSRMIYITSCHEMYSTYYDLDNKIFAWIYATGFDSYLQLMPSTANNYNDVNGHRAEILPSTRSSSEYVKGKLVCWLKAPGEKTDISDLDNLINPESVTEFTLPDANQIQFLFTGDRTDELGVLNTAASDIIFQVYYTTSVDGEQRTIELKFWNPVKSGGAGYSSSVTDSHSDADSNALVAYDFGNYTGAKADTNLPWTLNEILQLGFTVKNISGATGGSTSGDIKIIAASLVMQNISVYNFAINPAFKLKMFGGEFTIR